MAYDKEVPSLRMLVKATKVNGRPLFMFMEFIPCRDKAIFNSGNESTLVTTKS